MLHPISATSPDAKKPLQTGIASELGIKRPRKMQTSAACLGRRQGAPERSFQPSDAAKPLKQDSRPRAFKAKSKPFCWKVLSGARPSTVIEPCGMAGFFVLDSYT